MAAPDITVSDLLNTDEYTRVGSFKERTKVVDMYLHNKLQFLAYEHDGSRYAKPNVLVTCYTNNDHIKKFLQPDNRHLLLNSKVLVLFTREYYFASDFVTEVTFDNVQIQYTTNYTSQNKIRNIMPNSLYQIIRSKKFTNDDKNTSIFKKVSNVARWHSMSWTRMRSKIDHYDYTRALFSILHNIWCNIRPLKPSQHLDLFMDALIHNNDIREAFTLFADNYLEEFIRSYINKKKSDDMDDQSDDKVNGNAKNTINANNKNRRTKSNKNKLNSKSKPKEKEIFTQFLVKPTNFIL